jgi:general secretion pathway protein G
MNLPSRSPMRRSRRAAFTLMEVLVVVAILVVLAGIGVMVFRYLDESKEKVALVGIKNLETAVNAYKLSHGNYPDSLAVLAQPSDGKAAYIEEKAMYDPWNKPYVYEPGTTNPRTGIPLIYSQGANPGSSPPIRNWQ